MEIQTKAQPENRGKGKTKIIESLCLNSFSPNIYWWHTHTQNAGMFYNEELDPLIA